MVERDPAPGTPGLNLKRKQIAGLAEQVLKQGQAPGLVGRHGEIEAVEVVHGGSIAFLYEILESGYTDSAELAPTSEMGVFSPWARLAPC